MNNKGQLQMYALMLGLVIVILTLALSPLILQISTDAQAPTEGDIYGLDCANPDISSFDKIACYAVDLTPFYFVGSLLMIGGFILTIKIIFTG
jgi:hypothetical protein